MPKRPPLTVSLPSTVRDWVADRVAEGHYASASEYLQELVRQDRLTRVRESVDAKLLEALDSGDSREMTAADFDRIKSNLRRRASRRARSTG